MKVQFLGTAAAEAWPGMFCECEPCRRARELGGKNIRTRSSVMVDDIYKIDLPPDTYHHVLTHGINLAKVRHLLFTHGHFDHCNPSELELRHPPFAHIKDSEPLTIYGNPTVEGLVGGLVRREGSGLRFVPVEPFEWYQAGDAEFMPLKADHDRNQLCLFYVFRRGGKTFLMGNDTGYFPEESWNALEREGIKLDLASLDTTNGPNEGRQYHMGFDAITDVKKRLISMGCADAGTVFIATHFSHNGGLMYHEMEEALAPEGIGVAYDGMVVEV